jgi:hypothetical protein
MTTAKDKLHTALHALDTIRMERQRSWRDMATKN